MIMKENARERWVTNLEFLHDSVTDSRKIRAIT
jgi:hypothetical protein